MTARITGAPRRRPPAKAKRRGKVATPRAVARNEGIERAALAICGVATWDLIHIPAGIDNAPKYRTGIAAIYRVQAKRAVEAYLAARFGE